MEEIKIQRYKIRNDFCMCGKPKGFIGDMTKGEYVKYSDHKAVVETMQNKIDELEKVNESLKCCDNCKIDMNPYLMPVSCSKCKSRTRGRNIKGQSEDNWTAKGNK